MAAQVCCNNFVMESPAASSPSIYLLPDTHTAHSLRGWREGGRTRRGPETSKGEVCRCKSNEIYRRKINVLGMLLANEERR